MSKFKSFLNVRPRGKHNWILLDKFVYESDLLKRNVVVKNGFSTDLASFPLKDLARESAVIHDWLYQTHEIGRKLADQVFREAMEVEGIIGWRRAVIYRAVRLFGWWSYYRGPATFRKLNIKI